MKNTRKLIPALAMLLVSAVMMSTASFAWFSMNTSVSATGMSVTATVPASLYIDTDIGMANQSFAKAALNNGATSLLPSSSEDATKWYSAIAASGDSYVANSAGYKDISGAIASYRRLDTFYVKSINDTTNFEKFGVTGITVEDGAAITGVADGNENLLKALKVMVVVTDTTSNTVLGIGHYAPKSTTTVTNSFVTNANQLSGETRNFLGTSTCATQGIGTLTKNVVYKVDVYTYFDGEDVNCNSNNAMKLNINGLTLGLTFGACSN